MVMEDGAMFRINWHALALVRISVAAGLAALASSAHATPYSIANDPLFLVTNIPPNITLTLDDSGSMASAFVPDSLANGGAIYTDRFKSSTWNALYYNPSVTYTPPVDASGQPLSTTFNQAWINGFDHSRGSVDLSNNYRATISYNPASTWQSTVGPTGGAYYYSYNGSGSTDSDTNYTLHQYTGSNWSAAEKQNFANWYSFYRTRNLSVVSASTLAFAKLNSKTRVAWQVLNACHGFGSSKDCSWNSDSYNNQIARFTGTHKTDFYSWLSRLPASGGTPLRAALARAGDMYETSRPYEYDPGTQNTTPVYTCRQNYSIVMTDGVWNGSVSAPWPSTSNNNQDGTKHTLPADPSGTSTTYNPIPPYSDNNSTSLADIAFYFWRTDLRPTLANSDTLKYMPYSAAEYVSDGTNTVKLDPYWNPRNDPASWQHMVTYTVGVGLSKWLTNPAWGGDTYAAPAYNDFVTGKSSWPSVGGAQANVYDLYHAAIDSRGAFFSAEKPQDIVNAFGDIMQRIENRQGTASGATSNVGSVNANSQVYQARFDSKDWSGQFIASRISDGNAVSGPCYNVPIGDVCGVVWNAENTLASQNWNTGRVMLTYNGAASSGEPFRWSDLSTTEKTALIDGGNTTDGQNRLDWLRGDQSNEQQSGGTLRNRSDVLGDIVHSNPTFVGAPDFDYELTNSWHDNLYGSATMPENSATVDYGQFEANHKDRLNVVYVGGNDGFLHGFAAGNYTYTTGTKTYNNATNTGKEVLAFMPSQMFPNAARLSNPDYVQASKHRFFVDGQQSQTDAFFGGAWHSMLVGSLGAGGKGIYALDVTNPANFSESNASSIVKWEFSSSYSDGTFTGNDLGYTFGRPLIVRLHNGKWGVLVGNGYNSASGTAALYILDVSDGHVLAELNTQKTSCSNGKSNGIGYVTPVDMDSDHITDYVYAGDLCGDVWRFDLTGKTAASWHVSTFGTGSPTPLFQATGPGGSPQPITSKIIANPHPHGLGYGVELYFGTGKYFETGDNVPDTTHVQSIYGVWDHNFGSSLFSSMMVPGISPSSTYNLTRANLTQQMIMYQGLDNTTGSQTYGEIVRVLSDNSINWTSSMGFYLDLEKPTNNLSGTAPNQTIATPQSWTPQGEMVVNNPLVIGRSIYFTTTIPSADPCSAGGTGWVMALSLGSGGRQTSYAPFYSSVYGSVVSGFYVPAGVPNSPSAVGKSNNSPDAKLLLTTSAGTLITKDVQSGFNTGKLGWRELR
jgi:type IV pilus assembly protein PilY1